MDLSRSHRHVAGFRPSDGRNASLVSELDIGAPIIKDDRSDEVLENRRWFSRELDKIFSNFERRMVKRIDACFKRHQENSLSLINEIPNLLDVHPRGLILVPSEFQSDPPLFVSSIRSADFRSDLLMFASSTRFSEFRSAMLEDDDYVGANLTQEEDDEEEGVGDNLTLKAWIAADVPAATDDDDDEEEEEEEEDIEDSVFDEMSIKNPSSLIPATSDFCFMKHSPLLATAQDLAIFIGVPSSSTPKHSPLSISDFASVTVSILISTSVPTPMRLRLHQTCTDTPLERMSRGSVIKNWKKRKKRPWILLHCRLTELEGKFSFQWGSIVTFPVIFDSSLPAHRRFC